MAAVPPAALSAVAGLSVCALVLVWARGDAGPGDWAALSASVAVILIAAVQLFRTIRRPGPLPELDVTPDESGVNLLNPTTYFDDSVLLRLARGLIAVVSREELRDILDEHLPVILGTRRFWVSARLHQQRTIVIRGLPGTASMPAHCGEEWTTYALRTTHGIVGTFGVESAGGLPAALKQAIPRVTPLIGEALRTVEHIERLQEAIAVDVLTGVATRREGATRLRSEAARAQRSGKPMALLMLDLDHFKVINDRYGHGAGDEVLKATGSTIHRRLRTTDVYCRWGGEEFLIVLPDTDLERAEAVASGLLREIAAINVATPKGSIAVTASMGITIARPGETDVDGMVRRADEALYAAKAAGGAGIRVVLEQPRAAANTVAAAEEPSRGSQSAESTLPFPDRRQAQKSDRRRVPSPGRRHSDPR